MHREDAEDWRRAMNVHRAKERLLKVVLDQQGKPCIVCGGESASVGLHVGSVGENGRTGVYFYSVCTDHDPTSAALPESVHARQQAILRELARSW